MGGITRNTSAGGGLGGGGANIYGSMIVIARNIMSSCPLTFIKAPMANRSATIVIPGDLSRGAGVVVDFNVVEKSIEKFANIEIACVAGDILV